MRHIEYKGWRTHGGIWKNNKKQRHGFTHTTPLLQSSLAESKTKRENILWRKRGISVLYTLSETSASQVMLNLRWQTQQRRRKPTGIAVLLYMPHKAEIKNVLTETEQANRTSLMVHTNSVFYCCRFMSSLHPSILICIPHRYRKTRGWLPRIKFCSLILHQKWTPYTVCKKLNF